MSEEDEQLWPKARLLQVQGAIDSKDAAGLCDALQSWLSQNKNAFKIVLQNIGPFLESQRDPQAVLQLLLASLLHIQRHAVEYNTAVKHLLLELIPTNANSKDLALKHLALELFQLYLNSTDAKLAVKVASSFGLTKEDIGELWPRLEAFVVNLLQDPSNYTGAVRLMLLFEGLDATIDKASTISMLVAEGQTGLAEKWVSTLDKDWQEAFIEECVAAEQLKAATRAVRTLGLQAEFPNVEALYRQRSLARLMDRQLWPVALTFVGADKDLQITLLQHMVSVGQVAMAHEYRQQLKLPEEVLDVDPAQLAADEAARRQAYLQLPEDPEVQVLFVQDAAGLDAAARILQGATVIGMDVEWKPSHQVGTSNPAALLQVAAGDAVLLFDLLALCREHREQLDTVLGPPFQSPEVLKVGFGLSGDLSKLAGSWPQSVCFQLVAPTLDLLPLWVALGLRAKPSSARSLSAVGLSTLCKSLLGKPLDKSCQMSDWEQRPLSAAQRCYAALDAWVLPQLLATLLEQLGPVEGARLVAQHQGRYMAGSSQRRVPGPGPGGGIAPAAASCTTPAAAAADAAVDDADGNGNGTSSAGLPDSTSGGSLTSSSAYASGQEDVSCSGSGGSKQPSAAGSAAGLEAPVLRLLQQHGWEHCLHPRDAGAAAGPASRVKSIVLAAGGQPHVVVAPADSKLDLYKVAQAVGCHRRAVKLVSRTQCLQITGFAPGSVPPVGLPPLPVLLDWRLGFMPPAPTYAAPAAAAAAAAGALDSPPAGAARMPAEGALEEAAAAAAAGNTATGSAETEPVPPGPSPAAAAGHVSVAPSGLGGPPHNSHHALTYTSSSSHRHFGMPVVAAAAVGCMDVQDAGVATAQQQCHEQMDACCAQPQQQPEQQFVQPAQQKVHHSQQQQQAAEQPPTLHCGCGIPQQQLVVSPEQLLVLTQGRVVDVLEQQQTVQQQLQQQLVSQGLDAAGGRRQAPSFLCDGMLGRLCRWLRVLGIDSELVERRYAVEEAGFASSVHQRTVTEGRLFLTRDARLAARRDVGGGVVLLASDDPQQQLAEVVAQFGLRFDTSEAMSRCSACNSNHFELITPREAARPLVAPRVFDMVEEFWRCGGCGKVFWMGPKSAAAMQLLEGLLAGERRVTPLMSMQATSTAGGPDAAAGVRDD